MCIHLTRSALHVPSHHPHAILDHPQCRVIIRELAAVDVVGGALLLTLLATAIVLVASFRSGFRSGFRVSFRAVHLDVHRQLLAALASASAVLLLLLASVQHASACGGCPSMLYLHCPQMVDHATFHRLFDCLVPRYAELRALQNTTRCVATAPLETGTYLSALLGDRGFRAVDPNQAVCVHHRWPRTELGKPLWGKDWDPGRVASGRRSTSAEHVASLPLVHEDVRRQMPPPRRRWILLVLRAPPSARAFDAAGAARLRAALLRVAKRVHSEVRVYTGQESPRDTVALFAHALGVVGFHGAGFVNTLFALRRCCVVEITTTRWLRLPSPSAPRPHVWRSNLEVADLNRRLEWHVMNVSLDAIAERNGKPVGAWPMSKHAGVRPALTLHRASTPRIRCAV